MNALIARRMSLSVCLIALIAPSAALAQDPPVILPPADEAGQSDPMMMPPTIVVEPLAAPVDVVEVVVPAEPFVPAPFNAEGRSVYGLYLAGRGALSRGRPEIGAGYLAEAQRLSGSQASVREQAFTAALLAGDLDVAADIAPTDGVSPTIQQIGRLVGVVRGFQNGEARQVNAQLAATPIGFPHARAGMFVAPFVAAAAGDWDRAMAAPSPGADPGARAFATYHQGLVQELRGREDEADAILKAAIEANPLFFTPYARFLHRQGRRAEATALLEEAIAAGRGDVSTLSLLRSVQADDRAPRLTPQAAAAEALAAAAGAATAERANEFAVVYLRLALGLSPEDRFRVQLGQALEAAGLEEASREAFASVGPGDASLYTAAQLQMGYGLQTDSQEDEALAAFRRAAAAASDSPGAAYALASALMGREDYQEALSILDGAVLNTADQDWSIRFLRGAAYESLDRHTEAEAELWAALQLRPDDPNILNYLGYMWVDTGNRVAEGAAMIARAVAAEPDNGHYQDSLGWAQYRQGQYAQAVETLEAATDKEPSVAEINDHLGDAYWQVGRTREAAFQWNRVLSLEAEPERRVAVEDKLLRGLTQTAPIVTVAQD